MSCILWVGLLQSVEGFNSREQNLPLVGMNSTGRLPLNSAAALALVSQPALQVLDLLNLRNFMSQFLKVNLCVYLPTYIHPSIHPSTICLSVLHLVIIFVENSNTQAVAIEYSRHTSSQLDPEERPELNM